MTEPAGSAPTAPSQTASTVTDQETGPGVAKPTSSAAAPGSKEDWTDQVTGLIVDNVDKVRNRTTGPILEITFDHPPAGSSWPVTVVRLV